MSSRFYMVALCSTNIDFEGFGNEFDYIDPYEPNMVMCASLDEAHSKAKEIAKNYSEATICILSIAIGENAKCEEARSAEEWLQD